MSTEPKFVTGRIIGTATEPLPDITTSPPGHEPAGETNAAPQVELAKELVDEARNLITEKTRNARRLLLAAASALNPAFNPKAAWPYPEQKTAPGGGSQPVDREHVTGRVASPGTPTDATGHAQRIPAVPAAAPSQSDLRGRLEEVAVALDDDDKPISASDVRQAAAALKQSEQRAAELERDAERWQVFCSLWAASTILEARQDEEGTWSIRQMEDVEGERFAPLIGETPDAAIDAAIREAAK